jgi:LCP family protein required for cell wall assembly
MYYQPGKPNTAAIPGARTFPTAQDGKAAKKPRSRRKKMLLRFTAFIAVFIILFAGYAGWKFLNSTGHIFKGSALSALLGTGKPLKTDSYGRSNVLLFGTSEDDPGHPGGDLTDSIMIVSLDQKKHNAFIISVPRDLWVKYDRPCSVGYQGKINSVYECGKAKSNETAGSDALRSKVGELFGIDLQYSVHVNYEVLRNSIDALGGVDITIQSPDPRGIMDRNFDWRCKFKCYLVKYPNGPAHLTGTQALYLAQARGVGVGYGLPRANYDREANQRKIMLAAKDKATSIGFLANPLGVNKLLSSLGDNVKTNINASEVKTFVKVLKDTSSSNITSVSLVDIKPTPLINATGPDGTSIVQPTLGLYDYSGLQSLMKAELSGKGAIINEAAVIDVFNGSGVAGMATQQAKVLSNDGLQIGAVGNVPVAAYGTGKVALYDLSKGSKPATLKELESKLGVMPTATVLPTGLRSSSPFVVIVGTKAATTTTQ